MNDSYNIEMTIYNRKSNIFKEILEKSDINNKQLKFAIELVYHSKSLEERSKEWLYWKGEIT